MKRTRLFLWLLVLLAITAIRLAYRKNDQNIASFFQVDALKKTPDPASIAQIFDAVQKQDFAQVDELLKHQPSLLNSKDTAGYGLLHVSIAHGSDSMSCHLIEKGINPDLQDEKGQTALHYTARYNKLELAERLLKKGANIDIEDFSGHQPLWTAVFYDDGQSSRADMIKLFMQYHANPNYTDKGGASAKNYATLMKDMDIISLLKK
jgi:ankyrin repeat protein